MLSSRCRKSENLVPLDIYFFPIRRNRTMNPKGIFTLRVSMTYFANTLLAVAVLCLIAGGHTLYAQKPPAEKIIYSFAPATGFSSTGLTGDSAGNLYAATASGGSNRKCSDGCGSILKLSRPYGPPTTIYTFAPSGGSAPGPQGLIRDSKGNFYLPTSSGGRNLSGSVFKIAPSGSAGVLYSFEGGEDGSNPVGGMTRDSEGNLYGATQFGGGTGCGGQGCGIIYKLTPSRSETVLYRFTGGADGSSPFASPILDAAGNLYGTTPESGDLSCAQGSGVGCGTVWKLDTSGNLTVLHTFTGNTDGAIPQAGLVIDPSGNLYGDAAYGGNLSCGEGFGCGAVFKIDSSGNFTVLYSFNGGSNDGILPFATLLRDGNGNLYGTTVSGGNPSCSLGGGFGCGVVFRLDSSNNETILHSFSGDTADGAVPGHPPLITDGKGNLYGTTIFGGLANVGVIFQVQIQ
jgi:uncharacterized repeat protein (TIGR03803 family)